MISPPSVPADTIPSMIFASQLTCSTSVSCHYETASNNITFLGVSPKMDYIGDVREGGIPGGNTGASLKSGGEPSLRSGTKRLHPRAQLLRFRSAG